MKKACLIFLISVLASSCLKLEEKEFYLDNNCTECKEKLEREIVELEAIHYSVYDAEAGKLKIKYNPLKFQVADLYEYLQKEGFSNPKDSLSFRGRLKPVCCK
ncbi:MAG: hypothetical protein ACJAWV_003667 [Flammeovirgaceae bacterium]|jgi:hypothetical protein